jgi:hypothetical protein
MLLAIALALVVLVLAGLRLGAGREHRHAPAKAGRVGVADSAPAEQTVAETVAEREARLARLDGSLRAIHDGDSLAPRDRWDPEYVVGSVGRNPDSLFAWVRDSTTWIPYLGCLRGPVGVLMDRQGNDLDRALLLADLLQRAGDTVRLARGRLPWERTVELLPELVVWPPALDSTAARSTTPASEGVHATAAQYHLDGDAVAGGLLAQIQAASRFHNDLVARATDQSRRLQTQVGRESAGVDWYARYQEALTALEDHWWIQRQVGDRWIDLDPLATADTSGAALIQAEETMAPADIPVELQHELIIRIIGEQWSAGRLREHVVMEQPLRPADLSGRAIVLQGWPGQWPTQLHPDPGSKFGLRGAALDQHAWGFALLAGDSTLAQGDVYDDGAEHRSHGGGGLGGLGAGIGAVGRGPSAAAGPASELTAAWIEFDMRDPGQPQRLIRRAVFDLIGPAARAAGGPAQLALSDSARLTRSLSLMVRTEILPFTSRLAPEYVTHLAARAIVGNAQVLRTIAAADRAHAPDPDSLIAQSAPPVSALYSLAAARLEWSPVGARTYVDRLGLLTSHQHPAVLGRGFGMRGAIEVVAGEPGVPLTEADAFAIRLRQGVFDTNAEAFWWPGDQVLNTGEAYQRAQDWAVLTAARRPDAVSLRLSADARSRIAQDLDSGLVIVTPTAPSGSEHYVGWWRVNPRTGATHGVVGSGWGQCQEYAQLLRSAVIEAASSFEFEYAMCQGLEQGINAVKYGVAQAQARGYLRGLAPVEYQSASKVWKENDRNCVFVAITAGVFSTLPILVELRMLMKMRALRAAEAALAARRAALVSRRAALEAARKKALVGGYLPPLPKAPPTLPPPPRYVREAEEALKNAEREYMRLFMKHVQYTKSAKPDPRVVERLMQAMRDARSQETEAWETLQDARREAGRLAAPNMMRPSDLKGTLPEIEKQIGQVDKTITQVDQTVRDLKPPDFAETLFEIGFGGVLNGK